MSTANPDPHPWVEYEFRKDPEAAKAPGDHEYADMRGYPVEVPKVGRMFLAPLGDHRAHLDGSSNGYRVEVNGVAAAVSMHLDRDPKTGEWSASYVHASRAQAPWGDLSEAGKRRAVAQALPAVKAWADEHPTHFERAGAVERAQQRHRAHSSTVRGLEKIATDLERYEDPQVKRMARKVSALARKLA